MKRFEIEHIGVIVKEPVEMADWYQQVLGFQIHLSRQRSGRGVAFLSDSNKCMLEFASLPEIQPLQERLEHPLQLHFAFKSEDVDGDIAHLIAQGAQFIEECPVRMPGDRLVVLRDPWGHTIQLVKRETGLT